jgi:hypothetical protein
VALGAFNPDDLTALSGEAPRFLSAGEQKRALGHVDAELKELAGF